MSHVRLNERTCADQNLLKSELVGKELVSFCHRYFTQVLIDYFEYYLPKDLNKPVKNIPNMNKLGELSDKFASGWASYIEDKRNVRNNIDS